MGREVKAVFTNYDEAECYLDVRVPEPDRERYEIQGYLPDPDPFGEEDEEDYEED